MNTVFKPYYEKSIRLAPDGFSFFKHSGDRWLTRDIAYQSGTLLSTEAPQFFDPADHVTVVAARHIPMLVPGELYDPAKDSDYLNLQFDTTQLGGTFADTLGPYRAVFFLTKNEKDILGRLPFACQVTSEAALFYRFLKEQQADQALFVSVNNGFADILAMQKGEVAFLNRFHLLEPADIVCYLYNIMKQCGLRQPELHLCFWGDEDKKLVQLLKNCHFKPNIL